MIKGWNITSRDAIVKTTSGKTGARPTVKDPLHETKDAKNITVAMHDAIMTLNVRGMQAKNAMVMGRMITASQNTDMVGFVLAMMEGVEVMVAAVVAAATIEVEGVGATGGAAVQHVIDILAEAVWEVMLATVTIAALMDGASTIMMTMAVAVGVVLREENIGR